MDNIVGQVRRLMPHNNGWFTEGKIYNMNNQGKVLADDGIKRTPIFGPKGDRWEKLPKTKEEIIVGQVKRVALDNRGWFTEGKTYDLDVSGRVLADDGIKRAPYLDPKGDFWVSVGRHGAIPKQTKTKEEIDMLNIKTVVFVNEKDASECNVDYYVRKINEEKSQLDKLIDVKIKSKAIDKLKLQHLNNIEELIKLMDKYHG